MKNEDIKKAFQRLTPSDETKEKMFNAILEKASAEPVRTPWFIRFRPQISAVGALAACGVLFTFAALNPHIIGNKNHFVETKPIEESTAVAVIPEENSEEAYAVTTCTSIASKASAKATEHEKKTTSTEVKTSLYAAAVTTAAYKETTVLSSAATSASSVLKTTLQTETTEEVPPAETETKPVATTSVSTSRQNLYGDMYDYSLVSWAGKSYTTDYEEISYSKLVKNLGSGAAFSETSDGAYTILIYEIEGISPEEGFAVHYMGETSFYYFYCVE